MNENPELPDEERGLYPKYRAFSYGEGDPNLSGVAQVMAGLPKLEEVREPFFLLKFKDIYAREALMAYANACAGRYPQLAADIRAKLVDTIDDVKKLPRGLDEL